jgi:hypothetical protein
MSPVLEPLDDLGWGLGRLQPRSGVQAATSGSCDGGRPQWETYRTRSRLRPVSRPRRVSRHLGDPSLQA